MIVPISGLQVAIFKIIFLFFMTIPSDLCYSVIRRLPTLDADYLVITDVLEFIHPLTVIEQLVTCHLFN